MPGEGHILNMIQVMKANRELAKHRKGAKKLLKDIDSESSTTLQYNEATPESRAALQKELEAENKRLFKKKLLVLSLSAIIAAVLFWLLAIWIKWLLIAPPTE